VFNRSRVTVDLTTSTVVSRCFQQQADGGRLFVAVGDDGRAVAGEIFLSSEFWDKVSEGIAIIFGRCPNFLKTQC